VNNCQKPNTNDACLRRF